MSNCSGHLYKFLRTETEDRAIEGGSITERTFYDLYYCQKCLNYHRVTMRVEISCGEKQWRERWKL